MFGDTTVKINEHLGVSDRVLGSSTTIFTKREEKYHSSFITYDALT